ncbi:MAG: carboxypeptidase-like regulatory domain-containing protein, partial [bacterium]
MDRYYRFIGKSSLLCLMVLLVLSATTSMGVAGEKRLPKGSLELAKIQNDFLQRIQTQWKQSYADHLLQQKAREYAPEKKIAGFMAALDRAEVNGYQLNHRVRPVAQKSNSSIAGAVLNGTANNSVLVFDKFGYLAASTATDPATGRFMISGLPTGDYYVVARGNAQTGWQRSDLISLVDGVPTVALTLDLANAIKGADNPKPGNLLTDDASISGLVTDDSSTPMPLSLAFVFVFDLADTSIAAFEVSEVGTGTYTADSLKAGNYVVYADSYLNLSIDLGVFAIDIVARRGEYYDNASTPDQATAIALAGSEKKQGINFSLGAGGAIAGNITDANGANLDSMFVIAVKLDLANLSGFLTESFDVSMAFSDTQGNYVISGLSSGEYILRTISFVNANFIALFEGKFGKHAGKVLDEYYNGVASIFDFANATPVVVNEPDTTDGINFSLDAAGGISGNFVEFSGGAPVTGVGSVIAFDAVTGLPELALDFDTLATAYEIRPLPQGNFILFGSVASDEVDYLPQYYNLKDFANADPVSVTPPGNTENINFTMIRAGAISGVVNFPTTNQEISTRAISEPEVTIIVYNSTDGKVVGGTTADSLTHKFLVDGLPPGTFKVEAVTAAPNLAATYHGGGTSFDAANTTAVTAASGDTVQANIDLATGQGIISGTVKNESGDPIAGVLVIAYDLTGHAVSAGVSGFNTETEEVDPTSGDYFIPGLVAGNYFVRTFSLFQFLSLADNVDTGQDPLTFILGLLAGQLDLGDVSGLAIFLDA